MQEQAAQDIAVDRVTLGQRRGWMKSVLQLFSSRQPASARASKK